MASKHYEIINIDGNVQKYKRAIKQGRPPSGLGKPFIVRLLQKDEDKLLQMKNELGYLYNKNEIVRDAVHLYLSSFVYTELLNS